MSFLNRRPGHRVFSSPEVSDDDEYIDPIRERSPIRSRDSGMGENSNTQMSLPSNNPEPMDTTTMGPSVAVGGNGTNQPGHSGLTGGRNGGGDHLFVGRPEKANVWYRHFRKTYRFSLQTTLPQYKLVDPGYDSTAQFIQYKPGSMYAIPVEMISSYLSPQEFWMIQKSCKRASVENVSCEVYSEGIRLPFTTAEQTAVTANASAQYPICQWVGLDEDWPMSYRYLDLKDTQQKMLGGDPAQWPPSANFTSTFPNLSARATSRNFENEAVILIPAPCYANNLDNPERTFMSLGADIPIHQYARTKNGTTELGKVFEYHYKPKHGGIIVQSTNINRTGFANIVANDDNYQPRSGHITTNNHTIVDPWGRTIQSNLVTTGGTGIAPDGLARADTAIPAIQTNYIDTVIENQHWIPHNGGKKPARQPMFLIGMHNIRNIGTPTTEGSLLNANWEVVMTFTCTIKCTAGTRGIYQNTYDGPTGEFLYPTLQMGNMGFIDSTKTGASNYINGIVVQPFQSNNPSANVIVNAKGIGNRSMMVASIRSQAQSDLYYVPSNVTLGRNTNNASGLMRSSRIAHIQQSVADLKIKEHKDNKDKKAMPPPTTIKLVKTTKTTTV